MSLSNGIYSQRPQTPPKQVDDLVPSRAEIARREIQVLQDDIERLERERRAMTLHKTNQRARAEQHRRAMLSAEEQIAEMERGEASVGKMLADRRHLLADAMNEAG